MTLPATDARRIMALREGRVVLRQATTLNVWLNGLTISTRRCLVYAGGVLIRELTNETWTIPAGRHQVVTIDPIEETRVSGDGLELPAQLYQRFIANRDGKRLPHVALATTDFDSRGPVNLIRMDEFKGSPDYRVDWTTADPFPVSDGIDFNQEWKKPYRWYTLDYAGGSINEMFLLVFTMNLALTEDDANCRLLVQWGTGLSTNPTITGQAMVWMGGAACGAMSEFFIACEQITLPQVARFCLIYPPFIGVNAMPYGSFQSYVVPLSQITPVGATNQFDVPPATQPIREGDAR